MNGLLDRLTALSAKHRSRVAIVAAAENLTLQQLLARAEDRARGWGMSRRAGIVRHPVTVAIPLAALEEIMAAWHAGHVPAVFHDALPGPIAEKFRTQFRAWQDLALPVAPPGEAEGLVMTTSGTMGRPKLVALSHEALLRSADAIARLYDLRGGERHILVSSLSRGAGLISLAFVALASGGVLHLFSPDTLPPQVQEHMRTHAITHINASPSYYRMFLAYWNGRPFPSLQCVSVGGEPASPELARRLQEAFPNAAVIAGYGLTEAGVRVSQVSMADPRFAAGGIGAILPHFSWKVDPVPQVAAPAGELLFKGGSTMLGYLEADGSYGGFDDDGYFATGDLVRADPDGFLYHQGRVDCLIKVGANLVNPQEVEQVLQSLPGVMEARCTAVPHDILGYVLEAVVEPAPGCAPEARAILSACRERLETFKVPRHVRIVERLAQSSLEKVGRQALMES